MEASCEQSVPHGFDICCLIAHMEQPGKWFVWNGAIQFDELMIIHLNLGHRRFARVGELERLLEPERPVEGPRAPKILYAKSHVSYAGQRRGLRK